MRHPKLVSGLIASLALAVASCGTDESAKDLEKLDGDGFTVNMPGTPKRSSQSVPTTNGTLKAILYTSDGSEEAFSIGYTELPKNIAGNLHSAIESGAQNVGGTVHDEKPTTYKGYMARDARITGADDNRGTLFVRAILAKGRLYLLQFIGKGPNVKKAPPRYHEIVNSLTFE